MGSLQFVRRQSSLSFKKILLPGVFCSRNNSSDDKPRNLFEVYQKNSHWMNVYKRSTVIHDKIDPVVIQKKFQNERDAVTAVDIEKYINKNKTEWTPESVRFGAIGVKLGTSVLWTKDGFRHPCTLIHVCTFQC